MDDWLLTLYGVQTSFSNVTTRSFCLLKIESTVNVFSSKKLEYNSHDFSGNSTNGYSSPDTSEPLLHYTWISWSISDFFLPLFWPSWHTVETEIFFFCASPVIFRRGSFSNAFLVSFWLTTWGLPDQGQSFRDSETVKRCTTRWTIILLTFNCFEISSFLNPAPNKVHILILSASIMRYLALNKFYKYK